MAYATESGGFAILNEPGPLSTKTFIGLPIIAGLVNSLIAAFLLCRLPDSHAPSLVALLVRAVIYISIATLAGMAGARFYWNRSSVAYGPEVPLSFGLFAVVNAAGWVWVPSVVLLSREDSLVSPALAMLGSVIFARGLRKIIPAADGFDHENTSGYDQRELFAESLRTPPREAHAYAIAVCLYAAVFALNKHETFDASGLLALCAFVCAWKLILAPAASNVDTRESTAGAASQLARNTLAAVLITTFALFSGVDRRDRASAALALGSGQSQHDNSREKRQPQASASGISGYESIILWPTPPRKKVLAPVPAASSPFETRNAKRMAIRFDGAYWYFQPPDMRPGPRAHHAAGNPLAVNIQVNNSIPLDMEAHQSLSIAVPLKHCGEIQVSIENRDNQPGAIALAVLLSDSASPGSSALYLGQQPVVTSEPGHFSIKAVPAVEVLRFPVPRQAHIRRFDQITVFFLPNAEHFEVGLKIAIQEFGLLPR